MVPILRPELLILTKIKRCVHMINSTRPKSIKKVETDTTDIMYLMGWLSKNGHKVNFAGYKTKEPEKLYWAVGTMMKYWESNGEFGKMTMMKNVLDAEDLDRALSQASSA